MTGFKGRNIDHTHSPGGNNAMAHPPPPAPVSFALRPYLVTISQTLVRLE